MLQPSGLFLPNRIARYFFLAMDDVMGQVGLNTLLKQAKLEQYIGQYPPDNLEKKFDFSSMAALNIALEATYGTRGGRGMALRVGRASFSQGMKTFGALAGMQHPAFRALPRNEAGRMGLQALANIFNTFSDQRSHLEEDAESFRFMADHSPVAWGRQSDKPVCHALAGMIQECMRWASDGQEYYVYESACTACGDPHCIFVIHKTPMG
ncbi:MAG: 4-vinyl reductase [Anaerolineae bacterium]